MIIYHVRVFYTYLCSLNSLWCTTCTVSSTSIFVEETVQVFFAARCTLPAGARTNIVMLLAEFGFEDHYGLLVSAL
jgi:hypothetical protein